MSQPVQSSTNSARSRHSARIIAQTSIDAKLHADFEESGSSFDYSSSIRVSNAPTGETRPVGSHKITTAYLHQIQKGKLIQPFGCLLALDEKMFQVIAYSENAPEMLTMVSHTVPSVGDHPILGIRSDCRNIFTAPSATALGTTRSSALTFVRCGLSGSFISLGDAVCGMAAVRITVKDWRPRFVGEVRNTSRARRMMGEKCTLGRHLRHSWKL